MTITGLLYRSSTVVIAATAAWIAIGCGATADNSRPQSTTEASTYQTEAASTSQSTSGPVHRHRAKRQRGSARGEGSARTHMPAPSLGHPTKSSACNVHGQLPNPACTPGGVFARATVSQICTAGYSASVRDVPESVKEQVYAAYGIYSHVAGSYEVDHLVSLELGGDNSVANLWPEVSPGFRQKDRIENELHAEVCSGSVSLAAAQRQIARDWRHTAAGQPGTGSGSSPPTPQPRSPTRPSGRTPQEFCTTHACIPSFDEGHGTIVQCADGEWSHSGGLPGVCSHHGGVAA